MPMFTSLTRAMAWAYAGLLVALTLGSPVFRPETPVPHNLEHMAAFGLSGLLFSIGYRSRYLLIALAGIGFAVLLETLQVAVPDRHARWIDLVMDASGFCIGVGVAFVASRSRSD